MWFFRSIELLPRPRFLGLAPTLAMLAVWAVFEGTTPALFGHPVQPLWLAFVTFFALTLAARLPQLLARAEGRGNGRVALILSHTPAMKLTASSASLCGVARPFNGHSCAAA